MCEKEEIVEGEIVLQEAANDNLRDKENNGIVGKGSETNNHEVISDISEKIMLKPLLPAVKQPSAGKKRGRKSKAIDDKCLKQQKCIDTKKTDATTNLNVSELSLNSLKANGTFKTEIDPNVAGNSVTADNGNNKTLAHLYHRREFVCDRCSTLRRACFGMLESCNSCLVANKECTLNRPRLRKSKPRQLKVMEMAVALGTGGNIRGFEFPEQSTLQETAKTKQLELVIKNLRSELKELKKDKKMSEEFYKELEIENGYLKETVTTLQQLFKEQQNLVQLLEVKQIENFHKLEQLQTTSDSPTGGAETSFASRSQPQFQLGTEERRDWLSQTAQKERTETNKAALVTSFDNSAPTDASPTKHVSPNSSILKSADILQYRIDHEQVQDQLEKLNQTNGDSARKMSTTWSGETAVSANGSSNVAFRKERKVSLIQPFPTNHVWMVPQYISESNLIAEGPSPQPNAFSPSDTPGNTATKNDVDLYMVM